MTFRTIHLFIAMTVIAVLLALGLHWHNAAKHEQQLVTELEGQGWEFYYFGGSGPKPREVWFHVWNDPIGVWIPGGPTHKYPSRTRGRPKLAELQEFPRVTSVSFGQANLDEPEIAALAGLPSVSYLRIQESRISSRAIAALPTLPELTQLWLQRVHLSHDDWERIASCPSLDSLTLEDADCDDAALRILAGASGLRMLSIDATDVDGDSERQVTAVGLKFLRESTAIDELKLGAMTISDEMCAVLAEWPRLKWLRLYACLISDAGRQRLAARADLDFECFPPPPNLSPAPRI